MNHKFIIRIFFIVCQIINNNIKNIIVIINNINNNLNI